MEEGHDLYLKAISVAAVCKTMGGRQVDRQGDHGEAIAKVAGDNAGFKLMRSSQTSSKGRAGVTAPVELSFYKASSS